MPEPFLISKAVDVSGGALGKATSVFVKGALVVGGIVLFFWMVYVVIIKPHTNPAATTTQNAEQMTNIYYYPNKRIFALGGTVWGMDIGIVKYEYPKEAIVKTTVSKNISTAEVAVKNPEMNTTTAVPVSKKKKWFGLF